MGERIRIGKVVRVNSIRCERTDFLLNQVGFPYKYDRSLDKRMIVCQERIHSKHVEVCLSKHLGKKYKYNLEEWIKRTKDEDVLAFLKDIVKADESIVWTGFRVTGYMYGGTNQTTLTFDLFAKHPTSDTEVYTGSDAPNVHHQSMSLKQREIIASPETYSC